MRKSRKLTAVLAILALLVTLLVPMVGPASAASTYSVSTVMPVSAGQNNMLPPTYVQISMDTTTALASGGSKVVFSLPSSPSGFALTLDLAGIKPTGAFNASDVAILTSSNTTTATQSFSGNGTQTTFTVDNNAASVDDIVIKVTNVTVDGASATNYSVTYNANGTADVTFSPAPANGASIVVTYEYGTKVGAAVREFVVAIKGNGATNIAGFSQATSTISIPVTALNVPGGASGDIKLTASAPPGSVFSNGEIVIATAGSKQVTLAAESVESIGSSGGQIGVIDIKENMGGALKDSGSDAAVKLTLPPGFKWDTATGRKPSVSVVWGNLVTSGYDTYLTPPATTPSNLYFVVGNDGRELAIHVPTSAASNQATFLKLTAYITVDESVAKTGDVKVAVSGAVTVSPSELVVATYGEYGLSIKALTSPDLVAGKAAQKIGKFEIDESLKGSLIADRTITLTLPDGVKWAAAPKIDTGASTLAGVDNAAVDNSWQAVGSDGRTIKGTIKFTGTLTSTTDAAKLVFKDAKVTISPGFSGNLDVTVGGSQGLTGTITLGKVAAGVNVTASSTPDAKIGLRDQVAGDVTISEVKAGIINSTVTYTKANTSLGTGTVDSDSKTDQAQIILALPSGVTFSTTPTVSVVEGDLQIDTPKTQKDSTELVIPVKSTSTTPSTIKISGIKLTIDRTVPEGALVLKVKGTAVNETLDVNGNDTYFPGATTVAKVTIANCVTPAPAEQKVTAVFKVGEKKYTVNGVEKPMDVAPYIKDGRTYLPVRYIAYALGVDPNNVYWNDETQTVTLLKGATAVQLTIGSKVLKLNGIDIPMNVAPEIRDGRTMLPFRFVAEALGAKVDWDEATQTVTMNL